MPALIFDLDGTLVDTVYAHVFAWQRAFAEVGLPIDGWRIHRRIGMSGGLFTRAVAREVGRALSDAEAALIQKRHGELFRELLPERRPRTIAFGAGSYDPPANGPRPMPTFLTQPRKVSARNMHFACILGISSRVLSGSKRCHLPNRAPWPRLELKG